MSHRDERDGRPSASAFERIALCPASHNACKGVVEKESDAASRGSRIHSIVAGEKVEGATADERSVATTCSELSDNVVESTLGVGIKDCDEVWREHRLWASDLRFSGKPDLVVISGEQALIIDYKTGGGAVTEAKGNIQLRALAVLLQQNTTRKLESITVCIIQPLAGQRITICKYNRSDMVMATDEVYVILAAAEKADAPMFAGHRQCKYCPIRARCPEANASLKETSLTLATQTVTQLTAQQLETALDRCELAESVIDAIREEAKQRIAFGEPVQGWRLKAGVEREKIVDPVIVHERFVLAGGKTEAFMATVSVGKGALKDAMKEATGMKGKGLEEQMGLLLAGCVEKTVTAPSLAREKGTEL